MAIEHYNKKQKERLVDIYLNFRWTECQKTKIKDINEALIFYDIEKTSSIILDRLIERDAPIDDIRLYFEIDIGNNRKNPDLFKWACAFSSIPTIEYLQNNMDQNVIEQQIHGAIQGAIMHYKKDTLLYLIENNYPVLYEHHLLMAISRSQHKYQLLILDIFLEHIGQVKKLTHYTIDSFKESWLFDKPLGKYSQYAEHFIESIENVFLERKLQSQLDNNTQNYLPKIKI